MRRLPGGLQFLLAAVVVSATLIPRTSLAQGREEYRSTADLTLVLQDALSAIEDKEAKVLRVVFPAGWVGERHYHTGDVFVYVLKGRFAVDVEGEQRQTFDPGEVYHEALNKVMQARNLSTTEPTELILFQVGDENEPLMIRAK